MHMQQRLSRSKQCVSPSLQAGVMFGPGRVKHRLHSSSRVLVNSQELDPGVSGDVLAAYLQVTSGQGSEGTVGSSVN